MPGSRQAPSPARRAVPDSVVAIAGLGVAVTLAAATPIPWSITTRFWPLDAVRNNTATPLPTADDGPPGQTVLERVVPEWVGTLFWVAVGLALVGASAWAVRRVWRARPRRQLQLDTEPATVPTGPVAAEADAEVMRRGARTALQLLDEIPDPQDAVIRSWLALEQAAAASGIPRRPADSPTEFTGAVLASTAAEPAAVTLLLSLYQRARFSAHPVGLPEVKQARECVLSLCHSWSGYENALRQSVRAQP